MTDQDPNAANIQLIDNHLLAYIGERRRIAETAFVNFFIAPRGEELLAFLRQPLDVQKRPELQLLVKAGYECNWKYANLKPGQLETLIPDADTRDSVELFMANLSLLTGSAFPEEYLRVIQNRPPDIFQARPELLGVVNMSISEFMPRYRFPLDDVGLWMTQVISNIHYVEQLIAYSRHGLLEHLASVTSSYRFAEELHCKFDGALAAAGLWFDFHQTASEAKVWPHR